MFVACSITAPTAFVGEVIAENDNYTVYLKDGEYSLSLREEADQNNASGSTIVYNPKFSSLQEMKQAILAGDFSELEMASIQHYPKNAEGAVKVCNLNKLYTPILPSGMSISNIIWYGESYEFRIDTQQTLSCLITCVTKESFEEDIKEFTEYTSNENIEILATYEDPQTGGTVYEYETILGYRSRDTLYTIQTETKKICVLEEYEYKFVTIWVEDNGVNYIISLYDLDSRPTVDFVKSLGLVPYVEQKSNP
jgi:hypothetical protein